MTTPLISDEKFKQRLRSRNRRGTVGQTFFMAANILALALLIILFLHILNQSYGLVVVRNNVQPSELSDRPLDELSEPELVALIVEQQPGRLRVMIRNALSRVPDAEFTSRPVQDVLQGSIYPAEYANTTINDMPAEVHAAILLDNLTQQEIYQLVESSIIQPTIIKSWRFLDSILNRDGINAEFEAQYIPEDTLRWHSWISWSFITRSVSSSATTAGLLTALLGSFWIMLVTAVSALVIGVGAAIYLEEYATDNWINRVIEINIRNLAAIPSVIYGMLGLAVFVRALGHYTSGAFMGVTDTNGRTVISAGLTLALLILPNLIVNAQEAIRAVPNSVREASYGLGATKWQTVSRQVLPAAIPGIMTGIILSISRAVGETAPLLVVGASTFIGINPNGIFSKFTVVPIQIYQWTSRPEMEFKNVAAAAILALLVVMLFLNATAILVRNKFSRRY